MIACSLSSSSSFFFNSLESIVLVFIPCRAAHVQSLDPFRDFHLVVLVIQRRVKCMGRDLCLDLKHESSMNEAAFCGSRHIVGIDSVWQIQHANIDRVVLFEIYLNPPKWSNNPSNHKVSWSANTTVNNNLRHQNVQPSISHWINIEHKRPNEIVNYSYYHAIAPPPLPSIKLSSSWQGGVVPPCRLLFDAGMAVFFVDLPTTYSTVPMDTVCLTKAKHS